MKKVKLFFAALTTNRHCGLDPQSSCMSWRIKSALTFFFAVILTLNSFSQCQPMIIIDGNNIVCDGVSPTSIKLPSWLKATQTLNIGQYVYSIEVTEFTVNVTALDYSQNLSITSNSTVPAGKIWKIEAVNKNATLPTFSGTYTYAIAGTFTFTAPPCASTARIQVWGAGGGGGGADQTGCTGQGLNGGGGGGGGYAEGFYQLTASGSYTITVGAGGTAGYYGSNGGVGGNSSVGTIGISATGGGSGTSAAPGMGGAGGTGSGQLNFTGQTGSNATMWNPGGKGGDAANGGGVGGAGSASAGVAGTSPGGGGSGSGYVDCSMGGAGAAGKVIITFGASSSTSTTTTILPNSGSLQFGQVINQTLPYNTGCYVVPSGKVFELKQVWTPGLTTLYFGASCGGTEYGSFNCNALTSGSTGNTQTYINPFPIWLKAGIYLRNLNASGYGLTISGIEWTVMP